MNEILYIRISTQNKLRERKGDRGVDSEGKRDKNRRWEGGVRKQAKEREN